MFLWLLLLGHLQGFKKCLVTFVYSISQIVIDSKESMLVLAVFVAMFATGTATPRTGPSIASTNRSSR